MMRLLVNMRVNSNERSKITEVKDGVEAGGGRKWVTVYANDAGSGLFSLRSTFTGWGQTLDEAHRDCNNKWHDHFVAEEARERAEKATAIRNEQEAAQREADRERQRQVDEEEHREWERQQQAEERRQLREERERATARRDDLIAAAAESRILSEYDLNFDEWRDIGGVSSLGTLNFGVASASRASCELDEYVHLPNHELFATWKVAGKEFSASSTSVSELFELVKALAQAGSPVALDQIRLNPATYGFNKPIASAPSRDSAIFDLDGIQSASGSRILRIGMLSVLPETHWAHTFELSCAYRGRQSIKRTNVSITHLKTSFEAVIERANRANRPQDLYSAACEAFARGDVDGGIRNSRDAIELSPEYAVALFKDGTLVPYRLQLERLLMEMTLNARQSIQTICSIGDQRLVQAEEAVLAAARDASEPLTVATRNYKEELMENLKAAKGVVDQLRVSADTDVYVELRKLTDQSVAGMEARIAQAIERSKTFQSFAGSEIARRNNERDAERRQNITFVTRVFAYGIAFLCAVAGIFYLDSQRASVVVIKGVDAQGIYSLWIGNGTTKTSARNSAREKCSGAKGVRCLDEHLSTSCIQIFQRSDDNTRHPWFDDDWSICMTSPIPGRDRCKFTQVVCPPGMKY